VLLAAGVLSPAIIVVLSLACALCVASVVLCALFFRNNYALRAESRQREAETWRADQEEQFAALRRQFLTLSEDVERDLGAATRERQGASAGNARAARRERSAQVYAAEPRTRAQVRSERLRGVPLASGDGA